MRLPAVLAERYEAVAELPVQGAESDLLLVRDALGGEYVVKVFRRGYHADREVWAKLPALDSPHVLRILETGHADGRDYEVTAYAPDGSLRALMAGPLPVEAVAEIVAQLARGLSALHGTGVVHRDLKPENVLVLGADPLRLAIADFGLSKAVDQSMVFASSSRTLAYAAPESLSGQVSPARDWWSLGIIVRELLTGRAPFLGLSETAVVDHLATRPVSADDVPDPRLRLLCRGLLARDPRRRWTGAQVAEWLDGASPAVPEEAPAAPLLPGTGLPFNGRRYDDRGELARALVGEWDYAALYFFGRGEAGEAWRSLRDWLAAVPDDSRIGLVDGYLTTGLAPDVKLLHLVRWLDPALPPHFLGRRVTAGDLPGLAALAGDAAHPDHRTACLLGRELWEQSLLRILAGFDGGRELARVDDQWRAHVGAWNDLAGWLRGHESTPPGLAARLPDAGSGPGGPAVRAPGEPPDGTWPRRAGSGGGDSRVAGGRAPVPADDPPVVLLTLLALAARPAETRRALADAAARARASVAERVPWFEWLADGAGDDPMRLLAVTRAAPEAVLEVEARTRDVRAAEQRSESLRAQWAEREERRLAGRGGAVVRAVAWSLPLLAFWLLGGWVFGTLLNGTTQNSRTAQDPTGLFMVCSFAAWAVQCGSEVVLARVQGADYLPHGPWAGLSKLFGVSSRGLSTASRTMSSAAERTGRRGCAVPVAIVVVMLLLIGFLTILLSTVRILLWMLLLVAGPLAHAVAAGVRLHRWRQVHADAGRKAVA
ncbi:serine/threonine-protein kinase [Spirillospora sp. NBC_01491]|uniref:serine/threonine-protein kinase n=1 Tax=Spirillospora sp. NBC_01491 TaxID=2976007 RepID=UPI002E358E61|nr:serine/threonine-protein kinase [Spirillospora sp. NBC_01491]